MNNCKEEYIQLYEKYIKREGSAELLKWILNSDFFTAPASTKFHSAYEGGLCEHSVKVYKRFLNLIKAEFGEDYSTKISDESIAIIALLHDVCKINCYKVDYRNVKDSMGNWVKQPYFVFEEDLPYGHGEKSVYIINGFLRLTREEAMAINWHMGGFDNRVKGGSYALAEAFYKFPVAALFHSADLLTTYLDEQK